MTDKTPIDYHETAERYVLAYAAMGSRQAVEVLNCGLKPEDFYVPARGIIFGEISAQTLSGPDFDLLSVVSALENKGLLEKVGGHAAVADVFILLNSGYEMIRPELVPQHVRSIISAAKRRHAVVKGAAALERLRTADPAGAQELVEAAAPVLGDVCKERVFHFSRFCQEALGALDAQMRAGTHVTGIRSGLHLLDNLTGGFKAGKLYVIAARPGMGKTTLALDILRHILTAENPPFSLFVSTEMEGSELFLSMLAADSQVDFRTLCTEAGMADLPRVTASSRRLSSENFRLELIEAWHDTIDDVCRLLHLRHAAGRLGLVVVDYLQNLPGTGPRAAQSTVDSVAEVSYKLHTFAVTHHIPVIAIAQINRDASGRPPTLRDLKGSGAIEQDADVVILLDRPERSLPKNATSQAREALAGLAVLEVAKNRSGDVGCILLDFNPGIRRFAIRPDQAFPNAR